jgi:hypothetical protein
LKSAQIAHILGTGLFDTIDDNHDNLIDFREINGAVQTRNDQNEREEGRGMRRETGA